MVFPSSHFLTFVCPLDYLEKGCTLTLFLDWCWVKVTEIKTTIDDWSKSIPVMCLYYCSLPPVICLYYYSLLLPF